MLKQLEGYGSGFVSSREHYKCCLVKSMNLQKTWWYLCWLFFLLLFHIFFLFFGFRGRNHFLIRAWIEIHHFWGDLRVLRYSYFRLWDLIDYLSTNLTWLCHPFRILYFNVVVLFITGELICTSFCPIIGVVPYYTHWIDI